MWLIESCRCFAQNKNVNAAVKNSNIKSPATAVLYQLQISKLNQAFIRMMPLCKRSKFSVVLAVSFSLVYFVLFEIEKCDIIVQRYCDFSFFLVSVLRYYCINSRNYVFRTKRASNVHWQHSEYLYAGMCL